MKCMTSQEALTHIRYTGWASRKLLDAAKALPAELRDKNLGVSHESILATLAHTFFADSIWYKRMVDTSAAEPYPKEVPPFDQLDTRWRELLAKWEAWVETLSDAQLEETFHYQGWDGKDHESPRKHILSHVVNHATLHRGQVMAMFRQVGVKPPPTDLLYFHRELNPKE
jgi:uncharacterized damage-inducible protein DinB